MTVCSLQKKKKSFAFLLRQLGGLFLSSLAAKFRKVKVWNTVRYVYSFSSLIPWIQFGSYIRDASNRWNQSDRYRRWHALLFFLLLTAVCLSLFCCCCCCCYCNNTQGCTGWWIDRAVRPFFFSLFFFRPDDRPFFAPFTRDHAHRSSLTWPINWLSICLSKRRSVDSFSLYKGGRMESIDLQSVSRRSWSGPLSAQLIYVYLLCINHSKSRWSNEGATTLLHNIQSQFSWCADHDHIKSRCLLSSFRPDFLVTSLSLVTFHFVVPRSRYLLIGTSAGPPM